MEGIHILNTTWLGPVSATVLGLLLGSFYNVCIRRIPEDKDIGLTRSHCPQCQHLIHWYDNIPLLSFVWLRGRCRHCQTSISWEYPLVEATTGFLFLFLFWQFGASPLFISFAVFLSLLLIISVIDLHHRIIPNELSYPGMVLGMVSALWIGNVPWESSLLGWFLGGGIFWAVAAGYEKLTGREGLGGGDVKMLAMLGAWLGVDSILIVIVLSTGLGSLFGLAVMAIQKGDMKIGIPFGPFLSLAAVIYLFWGEPIRQFLLPPIH